MLIIILERPTGSATISTISSCFNSGGALINSLNYQRNVLQSSGYDSECLTLTLPNYNEKQH